VAVVMTGLALPQLPLYANVPEPATGELGAEQPTEKAELEAQQANAGELPLEEGGSSIAATNTAATNIAISTAAISMAALNSAGITSAAETTFAPAAAPPGIMPLAIGSNIDGYLITGVIDTASRTITQGGTYEVVGTFVNLSYSYDYAIKVETTQPVTLVLNNTNRSNYYTPLEIKAGANVRIHLASGTTNTLKSNGTSTNTGVNTAGISVASTATLTISGTGTLNALGGYGGAGIGGNHMVGSTSNPLRSGTIHIESGNIYAEGGTDAAGIGGGRQGAGGTTTISGGTVEAHGGNKASGGSGIGGGGYSSNGYCPGGFITISGGEVTARAYGSSSAIGGGYNSKGETVTITGGKIDARTQYAGTGIGAGGGSDCGTILITGGDIFAIGSNMAAGIGTGQSGGGNITITGGVIHAESQAGASSGVGGGGSGTATISISGGSVLSLNKPDNNGKPMIRINTNPKNGPQYGNRSVFLLRITLVDDAGHRLANTAASIRVPESAPGKNDSYVYEAHTGSDGIANMWLPEGAYDYMLYNPEDGSYLDGSVYVTDPKADEYDPDKNTAKIPNIPTGKTTYTATLSSQGQKVYGQEAFTLNIKDNSTTQEGAPNNPNAGIVGVDWYRESVDTPHFTRDNFQAGHTASAPENKGTEAAGNGLIQAQGGSSVNRIYNMDMPVNGKYWFRVHIRGISTGKDLYHVFSVDVVNVYTPTEVYVRDWDSDKNTALKPYTKLTRTEGAYGIPYDFDGQTVLSNPALGYDTLTYTRNAGAPSTNWLMAVPGYPFDMPTSTSAATSKITLNGRVDASEDATNQSSKTKKYYTVNYARNATWCNVDVYYVTSFGSTLAVPRESGSMVGTVKVPLDSSGAITANNFKANGGVYLPPQQPENTPLGWYIATQPHKVDDVLSGNNQSQYVVQNDFANFDPDLTFSDTSTGTLAGGNKLYIVYSAPYMIEVSLPTDLVFAAFESEKGDIKAPNYAIENNGETPVDVSIENFITKQSENLTISTTPSGENEFSLEMKESATISLFNVKLYTTRPFQPQHVCTLDYRGSENEKNKAKFTFTGRYEGDFGVAKMPKYGLVFGFEIA